MFLLICENIIDIKSYRLKNYLPLEKMIRNYWPAHEISRFIAIVNVHADLSNRDRGLKLNLSLHSHPVVYVSSEGCDLSARVRSLARLNLRCLVSTSRALANIFTFYISTKTYFVGT